MAKKDQELEPGVAEQMQPLVDDDAFLTTLSQGTDPSDGADELAGLLLELRGEVTAQMPPAPLIEGAEEEPEVISLGAARRRRRGKPLMYGLVGAAAATLLIAGSGAVLVNAGPGSPLYGVNQSLFGSDEQNVSVELAGTLEEMEKRSAEGDMDGTRQLLEEARKMVDQAKQDRAEQSGQAGRATREKTPATVTATTTVETTAPAEEKPQEQQEPVTVTQTQTETAVSTVVVTSTVAPANPLNPPAQNNQEPGEQTGGEQRPGGQDTGAPQGGNNDAGLPPVQIQQ